MDSVEPSGSSFVGREASGHTLGDVG